MSKGSRRSFYFNEENEDLLEFIDSQKMNANKFVIQLIRAAKESGELSDLTKITQSLEAHQSELRDLIEELKGTFPSEKVEIPIHAPISNARNFSNLDNL